MESEAHLIKRADLAGYDAVADSLIKAVAHPTGAGPRPATAASHNAHLMAVKSTLGERSGQELSLARLGLSLGGSPYLMPEGVNKTLLVVREAVTVGKYLQDYYARATNIDLLNRKPMRAPAEEMELSKKANTAAVVASFTTAYYVLFTLGAYRSEEIAGCKVEPDPAPDLDFSSPGRARNSIIYGLALALRSANTDQAFVKAALLYFEQVTDAVRLKVSALEYKEPFLEQAFKVEGSDFPLHGFEMDMPGQVKAVSFNRVDWDQIVGNTVSKHSARRTIMSLLCYDLETRRNPMKELGALTLTKLTYGKPGTGKSMEIAAIATELAERCDDLGLPFLFTPFPDNIISSFQGESAERMVAWMKPLQDPTKIIFAPIDDAENNLEERSNEGVSAGVKAVVGVFLRMTEGAYAVNNGNAVLNLYTNLPELIDKAVLSRIQMRTSMEGATTLEDFYDQDYIGLIREFQELAPGFVDLKRPDYHYMSAQKVADRLNQAHGERGRASVAKVAEIVASLERQYGRETHEFFARMDLGMRAAFPLYSSRDKRNIQAAVRTRLFDFDFPREWADDPAVFFTRDYDTKLGMIKEVMRSSLAGKKFSDIFYEESVAYFDNLATIADRDFERKVERDLQGMKVREAALSRKAGS